MWRLWFPTEASVGCWELIQKMTSQEWNGYSWVVLHSSVFQMTRVGSPTEPREPVIGNKSVRWGDAGSLGWMSRSLLCLETMAKRKVCSSHSLSKHFLQGGVKTLEWNYSKSGSLILKGRAEIQELWSWWKSAIFFFLGWFCLLVFGRNIRESA